MAIAKQLSIRLQDEAGALARVCTELARVAVNISAIMISEAPRREAPLRLVVSSPDTAKKVLDSLQIKYSEEEVLAIRLKERPGALGRVTRKLAQQGIDIAYVYGSIEKGSERALVILGVPDLKRASQILK